MHSKRHTLHKFLVLAVITLIFPLPVSSSISAKSPGDSPTTTEDSLWFLDTVGAGTAWSYLAAAGKPQNSIRVAVIDTGVQRSHPNLEGAMAPIGYDAVYDIEYSPTVHPNAGEPKGSQAFFSHGTEVASIIAARFILGGTLGVGGNYVQIVPINIYGSTGESNVEYVVRGFTWAINQNVDVINFSSGWFGYYDASVNNIIREAIINNITVVISSGNNNQSELKFPASIDIAGNIGVGALTETLARDQDSPPWCQMINDYLLRDVNQDDKYSCGSNYGIELDVMAPGVNMLTADLSGTAGSEAGELSIQRGTSFAAPIVSAVAAMIKLADSSLTPAQIQEIIQRTATKTNTGVYNYDSREWEGGWNAQMGFGLVNAGAAVYCALHPTDVTVKARLERLTSENHASQVAVAVFGKYSTQNADLSSPKPTITLLGSGYIYTNNSGNPTSSLSIHGLASGDYLVCAKPQHFLAKCITAYLNGSQVNTIDFTSGGYVFLAGEFNGNGGEDGFINAIDLELFRSKYMACYPLGNPPTGDCVPIDQDRNGVLNSLDWLIQMINYGKKAENLADGNKVWHPFSSPMLTHAIGSNQAGSMSVILYNNTGAPMVGMNYGINVYVDLSALPVGAGSSNLIIHYDPGVWNVVDADAVKPGIQVTTYTTVFPYSDGGLVDTAKGEINLGSYVGTGASSGSKAVGLLATLPFVAKAGISNTRVWATWAQDETSDSNMAEFATGVDLISETQDFQTGIDGTARHLPVVQFIQPSGSYISTDKTPIILDVYDTYNQVVNVDVFAYYDLYWHYIGSDDDPSDGWSVDWENSLVDDQIIQIWAAAYLPGGAYSYSISGNKRLDRTLPDLVSLAVYPMTGTLQNNRKGYIAAEFNDSGSGISVVYLYINTATDGTDSGNWVYMDNWYNSNSVLFTYWDNAFNYGLHQFQIIATDKAGNLSQFPNNGETNTLRTGFNVFIPMLRR
jgi:hypothetical protein